MAIKPTDTKAKPPGRPEPEDTALRTLSRADRKKLNMDSWEPSLLRNLLTAQDRLKKRK